MPEGRAGASVSRRGFLAAAAATAAGTGTQAGAAQANAAPAHVGTARAGSDEVDAGRGPVSVRVDGQRILVDTATLVAVLDGGRLVSLRSRRTGEELLGGKGGDGSPLALVYPRRRARARRAASLRAGRGARPLGHARRGRPLRLGRRRRRSSVTADPENGRPRPRARGLLVATRRARVPLHDRGDPRRPRPRRALLPGRAPPARGPAAARQPLAVADALGSGPRDPRRAGRRASGSTRGTTVTDTRRSTSARARALARSASTRRRGGRSTTTASAGGLAWRVNVFDGDWTVPAARYRDWLWARVRPRGPRARAPRVGPRTSASPSRGAPATPRSSTRSRAWVPPRRVLLHYPDWRTLPYDESYPTFEPSEPAKAFVGEGPRDGLPR